MTIKEQLINKINLKTKPIGSLGQLESIALQIGEIQNSLSPSLQRPVMLVFAADHGITDENVSLFPKEVTFQMVMNFLGGGAAINVFCKQNEIDIKVVDAGVDHHFEDLDGLIHAKVSNGTKNMLKAPAMTQKECLAAVRKGSELVNQEYKNGSNIIGFGEMGIGNTSSASMLMHKFTKLPLETCVGPGTGLDTEGVSHKLEILKGVAEKHAEVKDPKEILAAVGGLEIAMICGGMLEAASLGMTILVDGFISTSALLAANAMNPEIIKNCIFCHQSMESGHQNMLEFLNAKAILSNGLRLGEGTGAALAYPIVKASVNFLNEMASFEDAGVSNK